MVRYLRERLGDQGARPEIIKCALTMGDIEAYGLPADFTKASDTRSAAFVAKWAKNEAKLLHRCTLPLTGAGVVDMVITDLGVFTIDRNGGGMTLTELAPDVTIGEIKAKTEASYKVANTLAH